MAQGMLCDSRVARRVFARGECRNSVLFCAGRFGVPNQHRAQAFLAGTGPAASDEERGRLDASGGSECRLRGAKLVSAGFTRRASHAQRSARTESV